MIGYIYKITCKINNKIYIGKRQKDFFDNKYWGSGIYIKRAINKYGKDNFVREIIDTADTINELLAKEEYWVEKLQARDPEIGYNIASGGQKGPHDGCKLLVKDDKKYELITNI